MDIAVVISAGVPRDGQREDAIYNEGGTRAPGTRHVRLAGYNRETCRPKSQITLER